MEQRKSVFSDICLTFIGFVWFKSKCLLGAREMSQWLRAWAAFPEDLGLFPVSMWQLVTVTPVPGDPVPSSDLPKHCICGTQIDMVEYHTRKIKYIT